MTTTSKHKPAVNRAVNYSGWRVPDLRGLMNALDSVKADGMIPAEFQGSRQTATMYLNEHWKAFPADSEPAAWLLRASGSRAKWANVRAKLESAADKLAKLNARNAKRHAIAHAKEVAAIPMDMVRLRMIQTATSANDYSKERELKQAVAFYMDAHRGSEPGKVRAALWDRVKLAKELSARFLKLSGKRNAERRGAIATLRRIWAGDYGANGALAVAYAERQHIDKALRGSTPPALRAKAIARVAVVDSDIARLEIEREAERMVAQAAERDEWLAGGRRTGYRLADERGGALVRATDVEMDGCTVIGGTLETSQGASVPLRHAARVFAFVRAVRESGEAWSSGPQVVTALRPTAIRVGHFMVDSVSATGDFTAGCHRINWNETERLAKQLGLWDCPIAALLPDDEMVEA